MKNVKIWKTTKSKLK